MRKHFAILAVCALACALLGGCKQSSETVQPALDFRTSLMDASACKYTADITADFGQRVYQFSIDASYAPDGGAASLTITAPETIAGISAMVDGKTAQVTFDDLALEIGTLPGGRVAPMQLPQVLASAWTSGYIVSTAEAETGWLTTYESGYGDDKLEILTHFGAQNTPYFAEIYSDGRCVLSAQIDNFSLS